MPQKELASLVIRKIQIKTKSYTFLLSGWQTSGRCITIVWRLLRNRIELIRVGSAATLQENSIGLLRRKPIPWPDQVLSLRDMSNREIHMQVHDMLWKFSFQHHVKQFEAIFMPFTREMYKETMSWFAHYGIRSNTFEIARTK